MQNLLREDLMGVANIIEKGVVVSSIDPIRASVKVIFYCGDEPVVGNFSGEILGVDLDSIEKSFAEAIVKDVLRKAHEFGAQSIEVRVDDDVKH